MKNQKVVIKRDQVAPEPLELIAKSVVDVAAGFKRIQESRMNQDTVVVLLQNAIGMQNITKSQIKAVLSAGAQLDKICLKKAVQ